MLLKLERFNREWIGGEVSKFYSVKSFSYMYGPGLMLLDYNLGILYLLAMSSLATYGILLAGYSSINIYNKTVRISNYANIYKYFYLYILVIRCVVLLYVLLFFLSSFNFFAKDLYFELGSIDIYCYESLLCVIIFHKVKANIYVKNPQLRNIHNTKSLCSIKGTEGLDSIKSLHSSFIKELYKDRKASVKPFDREFILDTCYNCLDKSIKSEFLKRWGTKPCIYLIEYKYDPLVYYIGRTTLFKRRFHNHLKAESGSKLHLFLNLVGWEHFYISIIEECTPDKQGLRENYYLQKYLPLLNSVFSSSITEVAINVTLKKKLEDLSSNHCLPSTKNIGNKIRHLKPEEAKHVINNVIPEGVDISKLTNSIANFKPNPARPAFKTRDSAEESCPSGSGMAVDGGSVKVLGKRSFSSISRPSLEVVPVRIYKNADLDKLLIIRENKGKCGVYRWKNLINGKSYIGSSVKLDYRFRSYFSFKWLENTIKRSKSRIYFSLIKNGYSNFSVEILKYCEPSEAIKMEQYFIDLCKPEYNILNKAGSPLGTKRSEETKAKMRQSWSAERKVKLLNHLKILNAREEQRTAARERMLALNINKGIKVEVTDERTNTTVTYSSISSAAEALNSDIKALKYNERVQKEKGVVKLFKKYYLVKILRS